MNIDKIYKSTKLYLIATCIFSILVCIGTSIIRFSNNFILTTEGMQLTQNTITIFALIPVIIFLLLGGLIYVYSLIKHIITICKARKLDNFNEIKAMFIFTIIVDILMLVFNIYYVYIVLTLWF